MFLDFLFGKKKSVPAPAAGEPAAPAQAAPGAVALGTHIAYHPQLVDELVLDCFNAIGQAFEGGDLAATCRELEHFRGCLLAHLLKENVRFYIYLEHALAGDTASHTLVHQFRHEMDGIGKAVLAFLGKYADLAKNPALAASFAGELSSVGEVLVQRIRNEEDSLYPLYLPAY
ncbi:hemerythrin domain-containing protein [Dechloromonas sp. XY25]|uniref:Hemerythrin domain-containing protein n=1 Tax=Dechloromonas hankyongensis TaxID=2908002 RepID=A0ABS9K0L6_9RHOO|nr:hemerythrin domain-containing protein [Dechloromonas hankyongensis]MCG2576703.1 hemerythrin domain-containing protein [Dechloromonas hankyongensis]